MAPAHATRISKIAPGGLAALTTPQLAEGLILIAVQVRRRRARLPIIPCAFACGKEETVFLVEFSHRS
jgi:hypothetical protein